MELWHGDCLELMKDIPDGSVDMILCDLPYGTTACKWDSVIPFEPLWEQYKRVIKGNGAICLFGAEPFSTELRHSNLKMYKYDWIWEKEQGTGFQIVKYRPMMKHENVSVFYKKSANYFPQMIKLEKPYIVNRKFGSNNKSLSSPINYAEERVSVYNERYPTSIIRFNRDKSKLHPTQKPVALLEYLIKTYTNEGETVLDNCMGSGSTGVACVNTGREFIGIELDDTYFEIAKKRIGQAKGGE